MRSFQAPESFVIKSEKFFDFFQFFFLNVGVDVIEIKDALFSLRSLRSLGSLGPSARSLHFFREKSFFNQNCRFCSLNGISIRENQIESFFLPNILIEGELQ